MIELAKENMHVKNLDTNKKEKINFAISINLILQNALINSIGNGPFTSPSKALVNNLEVI